MASRAITGCLSSSPIPLLFSEASLPPLRVTLTHFTISSYERALRLPTSFPISGLARLGVKPRLCRSSWRAFPFTHRSCFILLLLEGLFLLVLPFLLGICICSLWSPSFPLHAPALILFYLAKVRLSLTLTLSPLTIWCFGLTALLHFLLEKAAPAYLPTALSVALRPLFPFQQAQYVQVFPLKPAPLCTLFAGLGSTNKPATSLLCLSDSRSVLTALSSSPSFLLSQPLWQIWQELSSLSSCSIRLQWVLRHLFLAGTTWLMSWPDGERYLFPLQSLVVSLLLSLVFTLVFSRTGGVLFHRSSLTHRFRRFPLRNLCSLVMLAVFSLVYAATDTVFC